MIDATVRQALQARLDASRAALLAALADVTDRDFATDLGGETVVQLLARLATEENQAANEALGETSATRSVERPMPPQVVHALAGARYRTSRYLESGDADADISAALVAAFEEREREAARRIEARPPLPPMPAPAQAPDIPMIPPEQARRA